MVTWEQKSSANSHLTGRDKLQRAKGRLQVGSVRLEVVQSLGNVGLELRGALARRAVGRDLVEGWAAHLDGCEVFRWVMGWLVDGKEAHYLEFGRKSRGEFDG